MLIKDNTVEYNASQEKKETILSWNYSRWRYRHDKPACRLLKTSQESHDWLISFKQRHRVLISSPLSPSQKECETNPSREEKNAAVFVNRISWKNHNHFIHKSYSSEHNKSTSRKKKILTPKCHKKVLYAGP